MREIIIKKNEASQRLDKLLGKYLNKAPKSFLYKMLRKKNITLNGKKADGSEKLCEGDLVKLFLSDETIAGFSEVQIQQVKAKVAVVYEDEEILILNKAAGVLSQKAKPEDVSMVEHVISYLLETKALTKEELISFRPGICNRLDRNTSGLLVAGKSLEGLQRMNELFKDRSLHKYYRCIVVGHLKQSQKIKGWLLKDEVKNQVQIFQTEKKDSLPIETEYLPLGTYEIFGKTYTYLEVNLITGRSHQIRAHLASQGHPLIGDTKYGNAKINQELKQKYKLNHQLLHAYRMEFPDMEGRLKHLSKKTFIAPLPAIFQKFLGAQF